MKYIAIITLYLYKIFVSPFLFSLFGNGCRFSPTCSEYAIASISRYGILKGIQLSLKRLSKCHPWSKMVIDPVPNDLT